LFVIHYNPFSEIKSPAQRWTFLLKNTKNNSLCKTNFTDNKKLLFNTTPNKS
jgi:hypothetical protein